jgi:hypothetical protein
MRKLNPAFYTLAMVLFTLSGFAQEKLIRIDSASVSWRQNDLPASFYDKELARLLVPQNTQFGVVRIPSLRCESSLTYDSVNHQLVYIEAATSIYDATYKATNTYRPLSARKWARKTQGKNEKEEINMVSVVPRKRPHNYVSPDVRTFTLAINDEQAQKLKKMWTDAVQNAEGKEDFILDGTTWDFFMGNQWAKSHERQNALVKYANELMDSICNVDWGKKDPHDLYNDTIKWKSKDSLENVVCEDTCQLKKAELWGRLEPVHTQSLTIDDSNLFCRYLPVGSGLPIWIVEIYKQEKEQWRLVAKGKVIRPTYSFKAEFAVHDNKIVFFTTYAKYDSLTHEAIAFAKVDEVGRLSLTEL